VLVILWSVAIEEQFYLVWPLIIGFTPRKWLPAAFTVLIAGSLVFRIMQKGAWAPLEFHTLSCMSDLCIGGLGAFLVFESKRFLEFVAGWKKPFIFLIYAVATILFFFRQHIFDGNIYLLAIDRLVTSLAFLAIILEQNFCRNSFFKLGSLRFFSRFGKYTYGLYCFHMIGILTAATVLIRMGLDKSIWQVFFLEGTLSLALTMGLAYFSYHYYEKPWLKLKEKFARINTQQPEKALSIQEELKPSEKIA
jgi:peptidoglycan/LPS O-acetylase OafA/YrhL